MDTLLALILGFVGGIIYYFFDHKRMKGWHRKWYALTHKDPLPEGIEIGFVYGQPFSGKLYSAIFLSALVTIIIIVTGTSNLFIQLLYGAFILIGMMLAFYITPLVMKHGVPRVKQMKENIEKIDKMEAEMKGEPEPEPKREEKPAEEPPPGDEKKDGDDKDWRKGIKDYLDD